jgi:DNA-binding LacI/PurR family transcriptional regulator
MKSVHLLSIAEQTAAHLRRGLNEGRWNGKLPGVVKLAADCGVSTGVVRKALRLLEEEGSLSGRGLGRSRIIAAGAVKAEPRPLRVAILRHDARMEDNPQTSMVLAELMRSLKESGHEAFYCRKSQVELKHQVTRLTRLLEETPADAWVVEAGSRPLLEWCSKQATPCLALYGRTDNLPLARYGPDVEPAFRAATRHLLGLGHRRIALIMSEARRKPTPGKSACGFLEELRAHGVVTGEYNLPDWQETPEGLHHLLNNLFQKTPPTALIIDEISHFFATLTYCARRGIRVPDQVSLVSTDCAALADWCPEGIAHMHWDNEVIVRQVVRWVNAVRKGRTDRRSIDFPAEFVPGGSIGPAMNR